MGFEYGVLQLGQTELLWDGTNQPFASWNTNQDLTSAMHNSVNWYFERIDQTIPPEYRQKFINKINYGNEDISANTDYWLESFLKISAIEQVELLQKFHNNEFQFDSQYIDAVKDAIHISVTQEGSLYGKTGTGRINGRDINGWFIGYLEQSGNVYYFATNIQGQSEATGSKAAEITQSILSDLQPLY